jgi:opacity protein-like surface antigen
MIPAVFAIVATVTVALNLPAQASDWRFNVGIYGWLPTINGKLTHEVPMLGDQVEVDPGTLLDNLSFTAMGAFGVEYRKWALVGDVIYLKETKSDSKPVEALGGATLDAAYKLNSWVVNLGVRYEAVRSHTGTTLGILAGARYFSAESTLSLTSAGPPPIDETLRSAPAIWNGILGVSGRLGLGKRWFIPYRLDVGTGDSDFTWQGMAAVNYDFSWISLVLGYRYLDFNQGDSGNVQNLSFGGPELGVAFRF